MIVKLAALAGIGLFGFLGASLYGAAQEYKVTGYFLSAEGLVPGNDVTLGGVPIGTVDSVGLAPEGQAAGAEVVMKLDHRFVPLHRGTRATIRPKGLLGTMFVELQPAAGGRPIPSGGSIPLQDTASPVTLDQVNDIFDAGTREKVKILTQEGGKSLDGRGQDINALLGRLPAITDSTTDITAKLDERQREIDALQVEFDRVAGMMAAEDQDLRGDLRNGGALLDVLAQHQQNLGDQFVYADSALTNLNAGLNGHQQDLNTVFKEMPGLLDTLRQFQNDSSTSLQIINPCMSDILVTLAEMQSAMAYRHPAGSADASGNMLRVDTGGLGPTAYQSTGAGFGNEPYIPCGGGR